MSASECTFVRLCFTGTAAEMLKSLHWKIEGNGKLSLTFKENRTIGRALPQLRTSLDAQIVKDSYTPSRSKKMGASGTRRLVVELSNGETEISVTSGQETHLQAKITCG